MRKRFRVEFMIDDNDNLNTVNARQVDTPKRGNAGRIITGLVVLAVLVGLGKYALDRNANNIAGAPNTGSMTNTASPTLQATQAFQTVTISFTSDQLTRWINQMKDSSWPVSGLQTAINGNQVQVNGQSTASILSGVFTASLQPANNNTDVVAVTKVTQGGNSVSAATLAVVNTAVNDAVKKYLKDNNLSLTNLNVANGQLIMNLTGPTDKLNQVMGGETTPTATPSY